MKLRQAVDQYIIWRRTNGAKFATSACILHQFCDALAAGISCEEVDGADVQTFLLGDGRLTAHRKNKYGALAGFYRYAISRGYVSRSVLPPPEDEPRRPATAPPHIFSKNEVQRLLRAAGEYRSNGSRLDSDALTVLLLVLYGCGLRISEALSLTLNDADLPLMSVTR